ncbi:MAG: GDSL-type esterase/lipase family protein [Planctomycetota bacterium]|nr:GDSL-type esterase/lipase family protein [Planctomycetota bacterium]MDA1139011.1 GDSL-type esterase/lipase family protein [Planctomycetota bacterium]
MKKLPNALMLITWLCSPVWAEASPAGNPIMIDLANIDATNMSPLQQYLKGGIIQFTEKVSSPPGADFFYLRYRFEVRGDGVYRLHIKGREPGARQLSRYSYVVDDGPVRDVFYRRQVNGPRGRVEGRDKLKLAAGEHTVELRFYPSQRMRVMSRVDGEYVGHIVSIDSMGFLPVTMEKATPAPPRTEEQRLLIKHGDSVVFFGDSITDEEYFPGHFERILRKTYPGEEILCYNTGVSGNRIWEGLARIDDVLGLNPTWVVTAFGVNDCMHMSPEEFEETYETVILRLQKDGIRVLCTTPSGLLPGLEKNGRYFHTPDRARGFDRTMAHGARAVVDLAKKHGCLLSDSLGVLTGCGIPRDQLMANQWHPNLEGGRLMALSILRELGLSKADVAKTLDSNDMEYFQVLEKRPPVTHPRHEVRERLPGVKPEGDIVVVSSFTDNAVYAFEAETGKEIACVPVGHHPMDMAYSAKRKELYVTCEAVGKIEVISIPDFKLKAAIKVGDIYPLAIELTKDEDTAWTGNYWAAGVTEIDLAEHKVKRTISAGAGAFVESLLFLEKRGLLLAGTQKGLVAIDTAAGKIIKTLPLDYIGCLVRDPAGVRAIDTGNWRTHTLSVPDLVVTKTAPQPLPTRAVTADDKTGDVWAGNSDTHKLVKISGKSGEIREVANVDFPFGITIIRTDAY